MNLSETIPQTGNMVLRPKVLKTINIRQHKIELARIMGVGEQSIINYIAKNDPRLTQYAPLEYIRKVMQCLEASELLEPQTPTR